MVSCSRLVCLIIQTLFLYSYNTKLLTGGINEYEMLRTFNCGIGAVLVVKKEDELDVLQRLLANGAMKIGEIKQKQQDSPSVIVNNFDKSMEAIMKPFIPATITKIATPKKRVAVLISGSGTNLQALINATQDPTKHMGAEIVLVISNKPDVQGLKRAENANIPTKVIYKQL